MKLNKKAAIMISDVINNLNKDKNLHSFVTRYLHTRCLNVEIESGGYNPRCRYRFNKPETDVLSLYETLKIDQTKVGQIFWAVNDPYSDVLLTLTAAGLKIQDELLASAAFFLILAQLWNQTVDRYIPEGIDEIIMLEAMDKKMTLKDQLKRHKTPLYLLADYLLPKQFNQFSTGVVADPARMTNLLYTDTCRRIERIFRANYILTDIKANKRRYFTGIEPYYRQMQAELVKAAA